MDDERDQPSPNRPVLPTVTDPDPLVYLLHELMHRYVPFAVLEDIVRETEQPDFAPAQYFSPVALYAQELAARLRGYLCPGCGARDTASRGEPCGVCGTVRVDRRR